MAKNHTSIPFLFPPDIPPYPPESTTTPPSQSSPPPLFCSSKSTSSLDSPYRSSPSPPLKLHSRSSSSHEPPTAFGPCAACKFHNRKCSGDCYLASFLPANEAHKLAVVESLFGSENVGDFLQKNSNSAYIPLLLLLKDTSQEHGQLDSGHKNNSLSETEVYNKLCVCISIKDESKIREQIQESKAHISSLLSSDTNNRDHIVEKILSSYEKSLSILYRSELQNSAALIDTHSGSNDPDSPAYKCDSPGTCSANFDEVCAESSKKRKLQPTSTQHSPKRASDQTEKSPLNYLLRKDQGFVGKSRLNRSNKGQDS